MAAVSAEGSTVWVLIRRLNSSWNRSIALVVRALFHWLRGNRVKAKSRSPASSTLDYTDEDEDFISVLVKGVRVDTLIATVIRGENRWLVHHSEDGPLNEFRAISEVAGFIAFGDAKWRRQSWMRAPWAVAPQPKLRGRVGI